MRRANLKKRISTLRRELVEAKAELTSLDERASTESKIQLTDLFDVEDLQELQDTFANAVGVASLITTPNGTPLTRPSNFCSLCQDIIRATDKGQRNCWKSDAEIGRHNPDGPVVQPCLSGGLWDCGASITVNGEHIGNWLIGQVRNEALDEETLLAYADEIGADKAAYANALKDVPVMSLERFSKVGDALFLIANLMSLSAYQNLQLLDRIDEVEKSHKEIDQLKQYLDNIIDSMPSMLVGVDLDGRITYWNLGAANTTGISHADATGRPLTDVLPNLREEMDTVARAIEESRPIHAEQFSEDVGGEQRYSDVFIYPLIANGVQGAIIRVDDTTERVRIEEMMIQSEKMLSVGGLAAGMAHEINNPLAVILGSAKLLQKRLLGDSRKNREAAQALGLDLGAVAEYMRIRSADSMIEAIIESATRASSVVTNMLSFSRKSAGDASEQDPTAILDKSVELVKSGHDLKSQYNFKDIVFERDYPDPPVTILCDPSKLQQVFFNILINGAQAMTGEEPDTGREPTFSLACKTVGRFVSIEITDNGPGMTAEVRKHVFEPFFTTKEPGVGTGLGMSVSYFIVTEVLGGTIAVSSRPGRGTTFHITLPGVNE